MYLLQCCDGSLYCGITNDLEKRIEKHNAGTGARYTRSRLPVVLCYEVYGFTRSEALKIEHAVKQLPASKKVQYLQDLKQP